MRKQEEKAGKGTRQDGAALDSFRCCLYESGRDAGRTALDVKHHWHEEVELLYFRSGTYHLIINMDEFTVDEECFCFINSGDLHAVTKLEDGEVYSLLYHPAIISFEASDGPQERLIRPLMKGELALPQFIRISDLAFLAMKSAFDELVHYFETFGGMTPTCIGNCLRLTGASDQLIVKADILKIIALLNSYGMVNEKSADPQKQVKVIKDAVTYIHDNYRQKIYIRDLADLTGLNEQYFIRFFGNTLGKSPVEYINGYRIRQAQMMLKSTDLAVAKVAETCGFHNMGNFIKIFKDVSGMTPLKYRKSGKKSDTPDHWELAGF